MQGIFTLGGAQPGMSTSAQTACSPPPSPSGRPGGRWRVQWLALAAVTALAAVNLALAYQRILPARGPMHWDEASHALQGLVIAGDIGSGDLLAFLFDSYRQVYWPPVFSWISGPIFLLFGASTEAARLSSLIALLPLPAVLFLAGRRLGPAPTSTANNSEAVGGNPSPALPVKGEGAGVSPSTGGLRGVSHTPPEGPAAGSAGVSTPGPLGRQDAGAPRKGPFFPHGAPRGLIDPWVAGVLAAGLALTSLSMADMATYAMLEAPGLLGLSAGIWLYFRSLDRPTVAGSVLLGAAMMLTYLAKSNYGVLLILAVMAERLLQKGLKPKLAFWESPFRYALLTLGAAAAVWFAHLPKLRNSWMALVNSPYGPVEAYTIDGLLYYPRALVSLLGPQWLAALILIAAAASLTRLGNPKVRFLMLFLFMQMALATWTATKLERHIATMLPALFLVTAFWIAWLSRRLGGWGAWPGTALALLAPLLVLVPSSLAFYGQVLGLPPGPAPAAVQSFRMVRELAGLSRSDGPLLLASTLEMSPPQIDWHLATDGSMQVWAAGSLAESHQFSSQALSRVLPAMSKALDRIQGRGREPATTRTLYAGMPMDVPRFLTEEDYAEGILQAADQYRLRRVAVLISQKDPTHYQSGLVEKRLEASGYRLGGARDFSEFEAVLKTYVLEDGPAPRLGGP